MLFFCMTHTITNRQLLREYRIWKEKLLSGEVTELVIPQLDGKEFRVIVQKKMTPFERFCEKVRRHPFPNLKRPKEDFF